MRCAHCGKYRWETAGAVVVGGIHICWTAMTDWLRADPNDADFSIGHLAEAQLGWR